jgi:hypothetical protein
MNGRILIITVLSIAALSVAACERDLPAPQGTNATNAPASSYAIELFNQNKTVKVVCEFLAFSTEPNQLEFGGDTNFVTCGTWVDGSTSDVLEYLKKRRRLERAVLSLGQQKGRQYKIELLDVAVLEFAIEVGSPSSGESVVTLRLSSTESRLVVAPE